MRVLVYVCLRERMPIVYKDAWETVRRFVYSRNDKWARGDLHKATLPPLCHCLAYYTIDTQRDIHMHLCHDSLANLYFPSNCHIADIISTVEFDHTGDYLATGDKGGRVVLFERNESVRP